MCMTASTTSSTLVPLTIATSAPLRPWASLLEIIVYRSPLERDVSSMLRFGPMLRGKTSHFCAWDLCFQVRKSLRWFLYALSNSSPFIVYGFWSDLAVIGDVSKEFFKISRTLFRVASALGN